MRKSNGKWYIRYILDGHEYSAPTGLEATERNRKKAQALETEHRLRVQEGRLETLKIKAKPFSDAAEAFLTWAEGEYAGEKRGSFLRIRSSFGSIRHFFDKAPVASITEGRIEDFKSYRRSNNVTEVSIRHDLHAFSLFFQYALKQRWVRENLIRKVAIPSDADAVRMNVLSFQHEREYFEACLMMDRASKYLASMNKLCEDSYRDLHDFGRLMIQQGCRPEEFLELRKQHVDLINRWLYIVSGKTKAARRRLKLTLESATILARRITSEPGPYVFPCPSDPQRHRGPTWRVHGEVLEARPGLSFVPYDLRHTFASRAAADGMPLPILAAILGHANLRSVVKYVHLTADNIDAETIRLEELRQRRSQPKSLAGFLPGTLSGMGEDDANLSNASEGASSGAND